MRRLLAALLVLIGVACIPLQQRGDWVAEKVIPRDAVTGKYVPWRAVTQRARYHDAICKVETAFGQGSGFAVGIRKVITCAHVIENYPVVVCTFGKKQYAANVLWSDPEADVAELQLLEDAPAHLKVATKMPLLGEKVEVAGFAGYDPSRLRHWSVSVNGAVLRDKSANLMLKGAVVGGYSGCPVLNSKHEAVGIVMGGYSSISQKLTVSSPKSGEREEREDTKEITVPLHFPIRCNSFRQFRR